MDVRKDGLATVLPYESLKTSMVARPGGILVIFIISWPQNTAVIILSPNVFFFF